MILNYYKLYYSFKSGRKLSSPSRGEKLSEKSILKFIELLEENVIYFQEKSQTF